LTTKSPIQSYKREKKELQEDEVPDPEQEVPEPEQEDQEFQVSEEGRDIISADIPNAFIQAQIPETKEGEERVMMKILRIQI
jgi:hypothetical protein